MTFLYEELETLRKAGKLAKIPDVITKNLNPNFPLRKYQEHAFENFIEYFQNDAFRKKPSQTLFHMATGSGKTIIMAGLVMYLYEQGYRNFLFFVNSNNVLEKTKENFLEQSSTKYLFNSNIIIDYMPIYIKPVQNFQESDQESINICFTTIQGLHDNMFFAKENSMTWEDFKDKKTVLIADEAHHLNVSTKEKLGKADAEHKRNWEDTVNGILDSNPGNVLLEFTATCDLNNEAIKKEYLNKIVCAYPLVKFREDKYSKEIRTLRSDVSSMDRAIQAIILSQYRLKVFEDNRIFSKPVVLFKSASIATNKLCYDELMDKIKKITGTEIDRVLNGINDQALNNAKMYFNVKMISNDQLAMELKDAFSPEHCVIVDSENITPSIQSKLNSLEDRNNPYRGIFEVKQLDEGWDVLNLFDIVRMYETRQSGRSKLSPSTISEAQLIGRGARYFPFVVDNNSKLKYIRKFDNDVDNPLRICEEMYYHCQNDSRYISELKDALVKAGLEIDRKVELNYKLKDEFKKSIIYNTGKVFTNDRKCVGREDANGLLERIINKKYSVELHTGLSAEENILVMVNKDKDSAKTISKVYTIKEIAEINYNIVYKALSRYPFYCFNVLKSYYPQLSSVHDFINDDKYLGNIHVQITTATSNENKTIILYEAMLIVLDEIREQLESVEDVYIGTKEFYPRSISKLFKDKKMIYKEPNKGFDGRGVSQNSPNISQNLKLDLANEMWFATEDNPGTSEEKACVKYIYGFIDKLQKKYKEVYLIRNEEQLKIYSFDNGETFEPDYILLLRNKKTDGYEQLQIFIEPKGDHLLDQDAWKEKLLIELKSKAKLAFKFATNDSFTILGFHFYNKTKRMTDFTKDMETLLS